MTKVNQRLPFKNSCRFERSLPDVLLRIGLCVAFLWAGLGCASRGANMETTTSYIEENVSQPIPEEFDLFVRYADRSDSMILGEAGFTVVFKDIQGEAILANCSTDKRNEDCIWWSDGEYLYTVMDLFIIWNNTQYVTKSDLHYKATSGTTAGVAAFEHDLASHTLTLTHVLVLNDETGTLDVFPVKETRTLMSENDELLRKSLAREEAASSGADGGVAEPKRDPETRLKELKELLDKELITPEEYEERRQKILDDI